LYADSAGVPVQSAALERCRAAAVQSAAEPAAAQACRSCASGAAEALLRSLRLRLRLRLRRGLQCGLECGVTWSATANALSGARAVERGARERGRAREGVCYERKRESTLMEFAPWGGRPVSCVSDQQCADDGGGDGASLGVMYVACSLLTGLPDGAEDGRYCVCAPFRRGSACLEATPVLQVKGILTVPSALLAGLALWRALRDLRECPREKRASPGALCLVFCTCAAGFMVSFLGSHCIARWTGGSATLGAITAYATLGSLFMMYSMALFCALVFENVVASVNKRTVPQKRWCTFFALLIAAQQAGLALAKLMWVRVLVLIVGCSVLALLWIRAARLLANELEELGHGSVPMIERARATRDFIKVICRLIPLAFGSLFVWNMLGVNELSPLPSIVVSCLLEAVYFTAVAVLLLRFQDYLGAPLRVAAARSLSRSRVSALRQTDQKTSMVVSGERAGYARGSGSHVGKVRSGVTASPSELESANSVVGQPDEAQKPDGAGPRTSLAGDGEPAGCVGVRP
jgi:hypothetical protein